MCESLSRLSRRHLFAVVVVSTYLYGVGGLLDGCAKQVAISNQSGTVHIQAAVGQILLHRTIDRYEVTNMNRVIQSE